MSTFIIAEAGANHNRDWNTAVSLISAATRAGASAVKFQTYTSNRLYAASTPDFGKYKNIPELISSIELPRSWHKDLYKICSDNCIEFMSTPFDEEAIDELYSLGVKRLKIAAFEARDVRLVRHAAQTKLPIIFSAGIGTGVSEAQDIIDLIRSEGNSEEITILHCNSAYPTPYRDINLGQMKLLEDAFIDCTIGLSDHTEGILVPPIAVTHGAKVIEKHFTLSRKMSGPDHSFAIEPSELIQMCKNIFIAESIMGMRDGTISRSEQANEMSFALRSIVAKVPIQKGSTLTASNITTKRPFLPTSIPASEYDAIAGRAKRSYVATTDIDADDIITLDKVVLA